MKIRRIQYSIDYIHILTFREEYKEAVVPYFAFEGLEYAIDFENTINESIRLIFKRENFAIILKKEQITFIYEGDVNNLKIAEGVISTFWEIYNKIAKFRGYKRSVQHTIIANAVDILEAEKNTLILDNNSYFRENPFGKLNDFACVYDFNKDAKNCKFHFGRFAFKEIKNFDLMPFNTEFNEDLLSGEGVIGQLTIIEKLNTSTHGKFKSLLTVIESTINSYKYLEE